MLSLSVLESFVVYTSLPVSYTHLEKVGLVRRLLLDCYDVMHTQSLRHVAEDVVEALRNWEAAAPGRTKGGEL